MFILRGINVNNLNSYIIKNDHIDCDRDVYDVLNESIIKSLNDNMKIIMNEDMFVFLYRLKVINVISNIPKVRIK